MFANPIFLFALAAAGAPVLIHLIWRRRRRTVRWPTLMFLQRVNRNPLGRRRFKEILLLALRTAALAFVALALARPGFQGGGGTFFGGAADCVLVVDNSASSGLPARTGSRLDHARARAEEVLESLGGEGRAALLTTVPFEGDEETAAFSGDAEKIRRVLKTLEPTSGAGSLAGALARAKELLDKSSTAPNREIHLFGDLQGNAFKDVEALRKARRGLPPHTRIFLHPIPAAAPANNLALVALALDPRPKVAGRTMTLTVKVRNRSPRDSTATLSAALHDRPPQTKSVSVAAGAVREVRFRLKLGGEGFTWGEARLDGDEVPYDDARSFCVDVRGPLRVTVVSSGGAAKPEEDEAFYLCKALDPVGDGSLTGIRVTHEAAETLRDDAPTRRRFAASDVVVLCGLLPLPRETFVALRGVLARGGGLLIFAGARDAVAGENHPLAPFLGGRIVGETRIAAAEKPLTLRVERPASPCFDDLRDTTGRVEFPETAVLRALKVRPAGKKTVVLAEYSNGDPALLSYRKYGGRVLWWTTSAHADDSNLPLQPAFLAVLHRAVSVLSGRRPEAPTVTAGDPLLLDLKKMSRRRSRAAVSGATAASAAGSAASGPGGASGRGDASGRGGGVPFKKVTVYDPAGRAFEEELRAGRLVWRNTGRAGVYRLEFKVGEKDSAALGATAGKFELPRGFAVVPDPSESEPKYLSAKEAAARLGGRNVYVIAPEEAAAATVVRLRQGRELFGFFLLAALAAVLAEALLANSSGARLKTNGGAGSAGVSVGGGFKRKPGKAGAASAVSAAPTVPAAVVAAPNGRSESEAGRESFGGGESGKGAVR